MRWLLVLALGLVLGCTPDLTAADARPYQSCAADTDCVIDTLLCTTSCGQVGMVAVARDRQDAFDELRGCWPTSTTNLCALSETCEAPVCAGGTCAIATCNALGSTPE